MLTRRTFLALTGAAALAPALAFAANGTAVLGGRAFGTYWRLTVPEGTAVDTTRLEAIVSGIDIDFSPFRPDSAISAFNRTDTTDWLPVSGDFAKVLGQGLQLARQTGGAFDPTIGPLVNKYGFGPIRAGAWAAFDRIGLADGAVRKADARLSLDLCGIAKGHALDRMVAELDGQGIGSFLLDLGGELRARGQHPAGREWHVAVESLGGQLPLVVAPGGRAIATSGIAAQSYGIGDAIVSHIIDPRNGHPAGGDTVTVSVLADDAATADGWATALMAMPHAEALETAEAFGVDALLYMRDGGSLRPAVTGRFADFVLG